MQLKSLLIRFLFGLQFFTAAFIAVGCQSTQSDKSNQYTDKKDRPLVDSKYSLTSDRQALEELRKDIPPEKKQDNDELALVLQWTQKGDLAPSKIREQWTQLSRKKRELFDRDIKKEREVYNRDERKRRDEFLETQKLSREEFKKTKTDREQSQSFYKDQTQLRSDFFANERERRSDFESDVRERRKSFEDYSRERSNLMNEEMRNYQKKWDALKKEKKMAQAGSAPVPSESSSFTVPVTSFMDSLDEELNREIEAARSRPGTALEAGE